MLLEGNMEKIFAYDEYLKKYISKYNELNSNKIREYVSLSVCKSDNSYSVLHIQPKANLIVDKEKGLIPEDKDTYIGKFKQYIGLAYNKKYDLILTPEYSVPIDIIKELIENKDKLKVGSLYCMCCESVEYKEIEKLFSDFVNKNGVDVCYDAWNVVDEKILVCCLLYVTKIKFLKEESIEEKVFLIPQFKTTHMKDQEMNFEASSLSCGYSIFSFGKPHEVKFLSLICADVFNFDLINSVKSFAMDNKVNIFNPQLNPKPQNDFFRFMRSMLIEFTPKDAVRIITLNWALGTKFIVEGKYGKPFGNSWSAVYDEYYSERFKYYIEVLSKNVSCGLDFAHNNRIAVWFFPNDEHVMDLNLRHNFTSRGPEYLQDMQPIAINKYLTFNCENFVDYRFCFQMVDSFFGETKEFSELISCDRCKNDKKNVCTKSKLDELVASILNRKVEFEYLIYDGDISSISSKHYKSKYSRSKLYICKRVHEKIKNRCVTEKFKCLKPEFKYKMEVISDELYNLRYIDDSNKKIYSRIIYLQYAQRAEAEKLYESFYEKDPNFTENLMIYYENEHDVFVFPDAEFVNTKIIAGEFVSSNTSII